MPRPTLKPLGLPLITNYSSDGSVPIYCCQVEDEVAELQAAEQQITLWFAAGKRRNPVGAGRPTGKELSSVDSLASISKQVPASKRSELSKTERECKPRLLVVEGTVKSYDKPWIILIDSGASGNYVRRATVEGSQQYAEALVARDSDTVTVRLAKGTRVTVPKVPMDLNVKFSDLTVGTLFGLRPGCEEAKALLARLLDRVGQYVGCRISDFVDNVNAEYNSPGRGPMTVDSVVENPLDGTYDMCHENDVKSLNIVSGVGGCKPRCQDVSPSDMGDEELTLEGRVKSQMDVVFKDTEVHAPNAEVLTLDGRVKSSMDVIFEYNEVQVPHDEVLAQEVRVKTKMAGVFKDNEVRTPHDEALTQEGGVQS
ncbi:unnamed protein product [Peronospora belbahrii]|uniref:Peptidase A2 domain-containing protein n=1 Tax=Peronospora belbahrii TaxID=622444 RepID=A0AAU9KPN7_9STRA|nr:unnamed protein product [Peronospora belbahrii]